MTSVSTIQLPPLTRQSMADLVAMARRMGIEPGDYAKKLIEDGLLLQYEAEESTFAQIMKPVRDAAGDVGDALIVTLVEKGRTQHHAAKGRKKK